MDPFRQFALETQWRRLPWIVRVWKRVRYEMRMIRVHDGWLTMALCFMISPYVIFRYRKYFNNPPETDMYWDEVEDLEHACNRKDSA